MNLIEKIDQGFSHLTSLLKILQTQVIANNSAIASKPDLVQLTEAEYQALSTADKNLETVLYIITG